MTNLAEIRQPIRSKMLINGRWCSARSGKTFAVFDPASGDEIARVPDADAADIEAGPGMPPSCVPIGVAIDAHGNVYFSADRDNAICRIPVH